MCGTGKKHVTPQSLNAAVKSICDIMRRSNAAGAMMEKGQAMHEANDTRVADQRNRRHGYADLLRYPKRFDINWRLWNGGTTRVLLWADPDYVRRYSASTFLYDSAIWDVQEPFRLTAIDRRAVGP